MTGYSFTLTCPECQSSVTHVNGAGMGSQTVAVAQCVACGREYAASADKLEPEVAGGLITGAVLLLDTAALWLESA